MRIKWLKWSVVISLSRIGKLKCFMVLFWAKMWSAAFKFFRMKASRGLDSGTVPIALLANLWWNPCVIFSKAKRCTKNLSYSSAGQTLLSLPVSWRSAGHHAVTCKPAPTISPTSTDFSVPLRPSSALVHDGKWRWSGRFGFYRCNSMSFSCSAIPSLPCCTI